MKPTPCRLALTPLLLLAACDRGGSAGPMLVSGNGQFRVLHIAEAQWKGDRGRTEMESALERLPRIDLVYAHNDPMGRGAYEACKQKGRAGIKFVGIDALPQEGRKFVADGVLDASIEYPTCGAAAVDLALLALHKIALPKQLILGTRVFTKANPAGEPIAGPGDVMLAALRGEQAAVLQQPPPAGGKWKIGMAQCTNDEPWRGAMNADIAARAKEYPHVELVLQSADDDTEKQRTLVRQFIETGCHAILLSPKESNALVAPCKEAMAKGIPVIVIDRKLGSDDFTCFVGGDNLAIGKAAGEEIKRLLPDGGNIVEIQGLMTTSPAQERHQGFVDELQLARPK